MSKNSISKIEYDSIVKYLNYYTKKYNQVLANYNTEYHRDIIFTLCLDKVLKYKEKKELNIKYISLLVRSIVLNYVNNKSNAFSNEIQTEINPLNFDLLDDDEKINSSAKYLGQNDKDIDEFIYNDSLNFIYHELNEDEKKLLIYLDDNADSYKYSVSKVCRDLKINRKEYDLYISKIRTLCKLYLI